MAGIWPGSTAARPGEAVAMIDTAPRALGDRIRERKDTALLAAVVVILSVSIVVASLVLRLI